MLVRMSTELRWTFNALQWKPTRAHLLKALSGISEEESHRIQQFRFKDDFKLSLVGRLMIRKAIQISLGIAWDEIELARSERGKPSFAVSSHSSNNSTSFYFNVSHDGDYTVLAASTLHNVGVDVMKFTRPQNVTDLQSFFKLMKRQFVDDEWTYIRCFESEEKQLQAFYRLWCLKESYVKALGVGIGTNSAEYIKFEISEDMATSPYRCSSSKLFVKGKPMPWTFHEYVLNGDHCVAIATENTNGEKQEEGFSDHTCVPFTDLSFVELIEDLKEVHNVDLAIWQDFLKKDEKVRKTH